MTAFSELPSELIIEVWRQVLTPEAVESFAVASKKIYALGSAFIGEHNELRAKFSSIFLRRGEAGSGPAETLKTLLLNPRAALYVRDVIMDRCREQWEESSVPESSRHKMYPEDTMELFTQSIKDCPFISEDKVRRWVTYLRIGNEAPIQCLVLAMLPNVHSLNMYRVEPLRDLFFDTINRIAGSGNTGILSRLTKVRLHKGDYSSVAEFDWVHNFAILPSVKMIEAVDMDYECWCGHYPPYDTCTGSCCDPDNSYVHELALPFKASAVTHLTLTSCKFSTVKLLSLLEGLRALESFDHLSTDDSREFYEPGEIVDLLRAHAKGTLQILRLRSSAGFLRYAGTLVDFEVMKELGIDYNYLCGDGSTLADVLPFSIEKLHLYLLDWDSHYMVELGVLQMTMDKAERLPNLREVTIEPKYIREGLNSEIISKMKQRCEEVGVLLNVTVESAVPCEW